MYPKYVAVEKGIKQSTIYLPKIGQVGANVKRWINSYVSCISLNNSKVANSEYKNLPSKWIKTHKNEVAADDYFVTQKSCEMIVILSSFFQMDEREGFLHLFN